MSTYAQLKQNELPSYQSFASLLSTIVLNNTFVIPASFSVSTLRDCTTQPSSTVPSGAIEDRFLQCMAAVALKVPFK